MSETIYHVVVHRRAVAAALQLNFKDADKANNAFAALGVLTERKVIVDDFGAKFNVDPTDIGHITFVDAVRTLEMQGEISLMQHSQQQNTQAKADKTVAIPRVALPNGRMPFVG